MTLRGLANEFTVMVPRSFGDQTFDIPICGLCGNTGQIDTVGKVQTPYGATTGIKAFCICPNGRIRKQSAKRTAK